MIGLPIAIALGALVGRSEYKLEVLRDATPRPWSADGATSMRKRIAISLKEHIEEKLYIEIEAEADGHRATAVIAGGHTSFVYIARDGEVLLDAAAGGKSEGGGEAVELTLHKDVGRSPRRRPSRSCGSSLRRAG